MSLKPSWLRPKESLLVTEETITEWAWRTQQRLRAAEIRAKDDVAKLDLARVRKALHEAIALHRTQRSAGSVGWLRELTDRAEAIAAKREGKAT
jgi:hypothetical protein